MSFRNYIEKLQCSNSLAVYPKPIDRALEIAGILHQTEPHPALFNNVIGSQFPVAGNLFCSKAAFAGYFGWQAADVLSRLLDAVQNPNPCPVVTDAPSQEVVNLHPNLNDLPILRHCDKDGGNYISAGLVIARHPCHGQNMDYHRLMQISPTEIAVRVVSGRHFDKYLQELKEVDVAVCIGNSPTVLAAAATSVALGMNELEIANSLEPAPVVKARTIDLYIPAETEFVLEGTVYLERTHSEGPFVDLTETYDVVRVQPVFEVKAITHRKNAIWQALLPGGLEHKLLMGMPREPTIFQQVNKVARCLDVNISPGGCSWLHAIVQIDKQNEDDGKNAIHAAFAGHRSCKHVYIVDEDIDIYDPLSVEWALATRFQGDRDLVLIPGETGSSLDPSAEPGSHRTTRVGFDLTRPLNTRGKDFKKAQFPRVKPEDYL